MVICRHERYRGSSTIRFTDGDPDALRPWKTTNQVRRCGLCSLLFMAQHIVIWIVSVST